LNKLYDSDRLTNNLSIRQYKDGSLGISKPYINRLLPIINDYKRLLSNHT